MRPQQWLKNLLMVVPLLASHELGDGGKWLGLGLALLAMCAAASAVYLVNDLLDLPADRMHPRKRDRPLASGWVPVTAALGALPVLAVVAVVAAWLSGPAVLGWVAVYTAAAMTYSAGIKGRAVLDVLWLAGLYTLRVVIGAAAADVFLSTWLAEVAMFGFLSLAFAKRYAELTMVQGRGGTEAAGRGYTTHDLPLIAMGGLVSGYAAVVVLGLYVNGEMVTVLYTRPQLLWLICPLMLYWFTRLWFKAHRRRLVDDPLLFALRDGPSWVVVLGTLALGVAAAGL
jgi:4-hydroxybenzoate polyprenyltransferase